MTRLIYLLLLFSTPVFAASNTYFETQVGGKIVSFQGKHYFTSYVPPAPGSATFFEIAPDFLLPEVAGGIRDKFVTVKARFFKDKVSNGRFYVGKLEIYSLKLPVALRQGDANFEASWSKELELVAVDDPKLAQMVPRYLRFLNDGHALIRLEKIKTAANAILQIRKLVLIHLLTTNYPKLSAHLKDSATERFIDATSAVWARGTHGIFNDIVRMIEDGLDPLLSENFSCEELLHESMLDQDILVERSQDLRDSLQGLRKIIYSNY